MIDNVENAKKQEKKDWIKLVNVLSCIAVVFLHTNGCFWNFSTERYWFTANIIECVFYFAVPCFFMISGATLMDYRKRYSLGIYFRKRARKTLIPYLAWSTIGILYSIALGSLQVSEITREFLWDAYINSKAVGIYWFFPVLFGLYLTIPVLAAIDNSSRKEVFVMAAIVMFVFGSTIPFVLAITNKQVAWNSELNVQMGGYVFYLIAGYLISEYEITPRIRKAIYIVALLGLFLHAYGTYILSVKAGAIIDVYKGYTNAPCIMYSVGVFVWCRYNAGKILQLNIAKKIIDIINPYTMGVYLLQFFIYTTAIQIFELNTRSILYRLGAPFAIIPIAVLTTCIIRKVPIIRWLLP